MSKKNLQMMAFIPKATTIKIYSVGFPAMWKEKLARLAYAVKPTYDYEKFYLPLSPMLGKVCSNWVHGLIEIKNMRKNTDDSEWIISLDDINEEMCREICVNLRVAVRAFYGKKLSEPSVKLAYDNFISVINEKELLETRHSRELEIIDSSGHIADSCAYNGLTLKIMRSLAGKQIEYNNENLTLYISGRGELMSQILFGGKNGDIYAYVFSFSLQTLPPDSKPLILLHCSRRRFKNQSLRSKRYFKNNLTTYIKNLAYDNYFKLSIEKAKNSENNKWESIWNPADKECYEMIYNGRLPKVSDLVNAFEKYNRPDSEPCILCTVSSMNSFADETRIGTGISALDKQIFYEAIYNLIKDGVEKCGVINKVKERNTRMNPDNSFTDLSLRLSKSGYKGLNIEIYASPLDRFLAERIRDELANKLADVVNQFDFSITLSQRILGDYASPMGTYDYKKYTEREKRIKTIVERLDKPPKDVMSGAIIILPKKKADDMSDVKDLLRCGFALSGRVTQFINPPESDQEKGLSEDEIKLFMHKTNATIADLFRQFGYTQSPKRLDKFSACPVIAIDAISHIKTIREDQRDETVRALPIMLKFDVGSGEVSVECPAINNGLPMTYYDACLQLVKLSMDKECEQICRNALKRYTEMTLKALENYYRYNNAVVIVSGDGYVRNEMWPGISNKKISGYQINEKYNGRIDIGDKFLSVPFNFSNSKLRIVRVRDNDEVPEYYILDEDESATYGADAIYAYNGVYYSCVTAKKRDMRYGLSSKEFSIDHPERDYCSRRLIEYYPLVLQQGDNVYDIIHFLNELRSLSPQFKDYTNVPLPLHYLGDRIREYIDFRNND